MQFVRVGGEARGDQRVVKREQGQWADGGVQDRAADHASIQSNGRRARWRKSDVGSAHRLADADAELAVDTFPKAVAQPRARLLVGAQRPAQLLFGLDQQLFVDDRRQDRTGKQVADVVPAPLEDPLLRDVLADLEHVLAVWAELAVGGTAAGGSAGAPDGGR